MNREQNARKKKKKIESSQAFCYSLQYWHWPTGGTAQTQRAGAVGGRLNWSRTVLDRAGSMTVMLLLKEGPDTTHTEHWRRGTDMEAWKLPHVATTSVNYGQMAVWSVMRPEQQRLLCCDGGSSRGWELWGRWCQTPYRALPWGLRCDCCSTAQLREAERNCTKGVTQKPVSARQQQWPPTLAVESLWSNSLSCVRTGICLGSRMGSSDSFKIKWKRTLNLTVNAAGRYKDPLG